MVVVEIIGGSLLVISAVAFLLLAVFDGVIAQTASAKIDETKTVMPNVATPLRKVVAVNATAEASRSGFGGDDRLSAKNIVGKAA